MALLAPNAISFIREQGEQASSTAGTSCSARAWVCLSVDAKGVAFARRGSICMVVMLSGCLLYIGWLLGLVYCVCDTVAIVLVLCICSVPVRCAVCVFASVRVTHTHTHPQRVPFHSSAHVQDHGEPSSCMFAAVADVARPAAGRSMLFIYITQRPAHNMTRIC